MSDSRDMVREFHRAFEVMDEVHPCIPKPMFDRHYNIRIGAGHLLSALTCFREAACDDVRALRLALITEELTELAEAAMQGNSVGSLDALCDLQYVLDGTVLAFGMDGVVDEAFRRVHASNMSKLDANGKPSKNEFGKVIKGTNYVPVSLEDLVR